MARRLLAGLVVAVALAGVSPAAGGQLPILRSATVRHSHIVLLVTVGDLRPVELTVARARGVDSNGVLLAANVRFRETIRLAPIAEGVVRWQSRKTLLPGTYFVQVTAVDTGGVTDCPHFQRDCLDHWSSVRRVVVASNG
jgi:hypothetical protein